MRKLIALIITSIVLYACGGEPHRKQLATLSQSEKYQKIDGELKKMQAELPSDDGEGWIWLSAIRDGDTIVYKYQESQFNKDKYDYRYFKKFVIENIQGDPNVVADQMNFKFIHVLLGGKVETINISPNDYN